MIRVYGLTADDVAAGRSPRERVCSVSEIFAAWGPWARQVILARRYSPLIVGHRAVWSEVVR